jgi:hypothetical protein
MLLQKLDCRSSKQHQVQLQILATASYEYDQQLASSEQQAHCCQSIGTAHCIQQTLQQQFGSSAALLA